MCQGTVGGEEVQAAPQPTEEQVPFNHHVPSDIPPLEAR